MTTRSRSAAIRRPALQYAGGKFMAAPWIISLLPAHRYYVEPYAGAASILLRKPRSYSEVINDLSGDIVNLFSVMRDPDLADRLARAVEMTPYSRDEFVRAMEPAFDPVERARRLLCRSFMGHGSDAVFGNTSGFRINARRKGSTPVHDWDSYPATIKAFTERLQRVGIENRPALEVIVQQDGPDTLFYVDPPYPHDTRHAYRSGPKHAYLHEMSDTEHVELARVLRDVQGMVLISGYRCPLYDELYADWQRIDKQFMTDGNSTRTECVWRNAAAAGGGQATLEI